jgi:hypothetical protein
VPPEPETRSDESTGAGPPGPRTVIAIEEWVRSLAPPAGAGTWLRAAFSDLRRAPRFRFLRWALLVGLSIRFILAPIASWGGDTTAFVLGNLTYAYSGSPYTSDLVFNPPLAMFLQLPFFYLLLLAVPPQSLLTFAPSLLPPSTAIGQSFVTPWVASPAALVALKLPLIASDVGATLLLVALAGRLGLGDRSSVVGGAYFLNPLVIWVSSVHGEPDGLAVFLILGLILCMITGWEFGAGAALALAVFAKAYPLVLIPLVVVYWWYLPRGSSGPLRARLARLSALAAGGAVIAAIFVPYLGFASAVVGATTPVGNFGGISVLAIYNVGSPPLGGFTALWTAALPGRAALLLFEALAVASLVGGAVSLPVQMRRLGPDARPDQLLFPVLTAVLFTETGLLLAYPVPQPENILAIAPLVLLVAYARAGRALRISYWTISLAGFSLYLAFGTPLADFTPLWLLLGPAWVARAGAIFLAYGQGAYLMPPSYYWFVAGIVGGMAMLGIWLISCWRCLPERLARGVTARIARLWVR